MKTKQINSSSISSLIWSAGEERRKQKVKEHRKQALEKLHLDPMIMAKQIKPLPEGKACLQTLTALKEERASVLAALEKGWKVRLNEIAPWAK